MHIEREEEELRQRHSSHGRDALHLGRHDLSQSYLSNTASLGFYVIACLTIRLIEFAALLTTFEEHAR